MKISFSTVLALPPTADVTSSEAKRREPMITRCPSIKFSLLSHEPGRDEPSDETSSAAGFIISPLREPTSSSSSFAPLVIIRGRAAWITLGQVLWKYFDRAESVPREIDFVRVTLVEIVLY